MVGRVERLKVICAFWRGTRITANLTATVMLPGVQFLIEESGLSETIHYLLWKIFFSLLGAAISLNIHALGRSRKVTVRVDIFVHYMSRV